MIASVFLSLAVSAAPPTAWCPPVVQEADEFENRLAKAGENAAALWDLHKWCKEQGKIMQARECLKKIVEIDPDHAEARKSLGHHEYDGKWFKSYYELSEYKRAEETRMLEEHGLVRFNDEWVPAEDEPYLRMGMVKEAETGTWITKRELEKRAMEAKYREEGWVQQPDMTWVPPDEQENWAKGLVKCGDQWLDEAAADEYHSELGRWWTYPSEKGYFHIWSTTSYQVTRWAAWYADQTYPNLKRAYGLAPQKPPVVVVLRTQDQYNKFAQGDQALGLPPTEVQGFSSLHYSFFAESWLVPMQPPEYLGTGVALWNTNSSERDANGLPDPFGNHAVKHAAALAYAEAIDPSLKTVSRALSTPSQQGFPFQAFWSEKAIPLWFRVGVAAYCERYARDPHAKVDEGYSPWWARDWSLDNIRRNGGPKPFDQIFAMQLNANDIAGSSMLINQAGMLVSFVLDGKCAPVTQAHEALKAALRDGLDTAEADQALRQAIAENEEAFHLFVKM